MEQNRPRYRSYEELLSRVLVEIVDNNAHMMTILDLQARILARSEGRDVDEVVEEINALLKSRRRDAIAEIEEWATGTRSSFDDAAGAS